MGLGFHVALLGVLYCWFHHPSSSKLLCTVSLRSHWDASWVGLYLPHAHYTEAASQQMYSTVTILKPRYMSWECACFDGIPACLLATRWCFSVHAAGDAVCIMWNAGLYKYGQHPVGWRNTVTSSKSWMRSPSCQNSGRPHLPWFDSFMFTLWHHNPLKWPPFVVTVVVTWPLGYIFYYSFSVSVDELSPVVEGDSIPLRQPFVSWAAPPPPDSVGLSELLELVSWV